MSYDMKRAYYRKLMLLLSLIFSGMGYTVFAQNEDSISSNRYFSSDSLCLNEKIQKDSSERVLGLPSITPIMEAIDSLATVIDNLNHEMGALKKTKEQVRVEQIHDTVLIMTDSSLVRALLLQKKHGDSIIESIGLQLATLDKKNSDSHAMLCKIKNYGWLIVLFVFVITGLLLWMLYGHYHNCPSKKSIEVLQTRINDVGSSNVKISNEIEEIKTSVEKVPVRFDEIKQLIDKISLMESNKTNDVIESNTPAERVERIDSNDLPFTSKPTIEAYNHCVYEFKTINENIASLRRKETKNILHGLFRLLALQDTDSKQLLHQIQEAGVIENEREQFVSLVSQIQAFLKHSKPIIDAWLFYEPKNGVQDYISGIRLPIGQPFDEELDGDILGDDLTGQTICWVYKMGYYFPGNTIAPYRERSVVSV